MVEEIVLVTHRIKGSRTRGGRYLGKTKRGDRQRVEAGEGPAKARAGGLQREEERGCWEARAEGTEL